MTSSPAPFPPSPQPGPGGLPAVGSPLSTATAELPAYLPGQAIDAAALAEIRPPTRGIRPRRRSRLQRFLIGLTSGTALLVLVGLLVLATVLSPFGAQSASRAAAEQEVRSELEDGEHIVARAYVSQRNWWDNFRESFGVLAATDRRLIFVALPPVPWVGGTGDDGPPELRVQSFSFDAPFTAEPQRLLLWILPGVVVQTPGGSVRLLVDRGESDHVKQLDDIVRRAQVASSKAYEQEQIGFRAPPPPAPVYVTHVVHGGESVTSIARSYRTTPDVVRQLNRLPNDRIRIGQHLRVPQVPNAAAAPQPQAANIP